MVSIEQAPEATQIPEEPRSPSEGTLPRSDAGDRAAMKAMKFDCDEGRNFGHDSNKDLLYWSLLVGAAVRTGSGPHAAFIYQ